MNRIIKIGMDVHTTNYTLCIFEPSFEHDGTVHCITQVKPEVKNIIHVIETFKKKHENEELNIVCGYEAVRITDTGDQTLYRQYEMTRRKQKK